MNFTNLNWRIIVKNRRNLLWIVVAILLGYLIGCYTVSSVNRQRKLAEHLQTALSGPSTDIDSGPTMSVNRWLEIQTKIEEIVTNVQELQELYNMGYRRRT